MKLNILISNFFCLDELPGQVGHVVCPPLLSSKITVSSANNTNRWIFYGTRRQILDWIREHSDITLESAIFIGGKQCKNDAHSELIIDLGYVYDQEQSYSDYIKSYFVDIYEVERVKCEIRPRIDSKDNMIPSLSRVVVANGCRLGDIVDDLEIEWYKPGDSYVRQAIQLFTDAPTPSHILSAKPPSSIQVATTTTNNPTSTLNTPMPTEIESSAH
ncbi:uncharacterized protein BX663DRAFT_495634 [Cokeromyces recurvatus]|uniref:uncharacterized protein n=1 Tax=Cokeromyces recurvatus TaxID=90255 RepID=UPI002220F022|nr:uncharacterized protein BX663DRAFT_495634 [Cokeromyces recurvatus]KAI7907359.1 hypothetical protein BX663DRAFT_495634 [Cokeromyces recurvatus]